MSESGGGAVSVALGKRVRAVKKKINKAEQIEQAVSAGKGINEDQVCHATALYNHAKTGEM